MADIASEAFSDFLEYREAIILIKQARDDAFDFVVRSMGPNGFFCSFGIYQEGVLTSLGSAEGKTIQAAATKAWETLKVARLDPVVTAGSWHRACSIAGDQKSESSAYTPIPGALVNFSLEASQIVTIDCTALEASDTSLDWLPRYQLSVQVDGQTVIEDTRVPAPTPPGSPWSHSMFVSVALQAGAHMAKLGFRLRNVPASYDTRLLASPKHPIMLMVRY
jgi:hypothetical protein